MLLRRLGPVTSVQRSKTRLPALSRDISLLPVGPAGAVFSGVCGRGMEPVFTLQEQARDDESEECCASGSGPRQPLGSVILNGGYRFSRAGLRERDGSGGFAFEQTALELDSGGSWPVGEFPGQGKGDVLRLSRCDRGG